MARKGSKQIRWLEVPNESNYPAAISYLSLIYPIVRAEELARQLRDPRALSHFKAKDVFRASGLSLLGISNSHVVKNHRKIAKGEPLSPILLVRDSERGRVIIADGYHRMCAVYMHDEDALIPCRIA